MNNIVKEIHDEFPGSWDRTNYINKVLPDGMGCQSQLGVCGSYTHKIYKNGSNARILVLPEDDIYDKILELKNA